MRRSLLILVVVPILAASATSALAATTLGSLTFPNTALLRAVGVSEPEIAISPNGTMAIVGLQWLFIPGFFGTHLWTGPSAQRPHFKASSTPASSSLEGSSLAAETPTS